MHLLKADVILTCQELLHHNSLTLVELIHQNPSPPLQPDLPTPAISPLGSLPPGSQSQRHAKLPPSPPTDTITPKRQVQPAHQPAVQHHHQADIEVMGVPDSPHRGELHNKRNCHVGQDSNIQTEPHLLDRAH